MSDDRKKGPTIGIVGTGRTAGEVVAALSGKIGERIGPAASADPVDRAPDFTGPHGRAWSAPLPDERATADEDATVAMWVVEAEWAHPAWHSYVIALIHLRPIAGVRPPIIHLPGATHEMMVAALSPDHSRNPLIDGTAASLPWLSPMNFVGQFRALTDAAAMERLEGTVREVIDGQLSPDTDFRRAWEARYGDACVLK